MLGRLLDIAGILVDPRRIGNLEGFEHVGEPDDRIERCPELMAHIGNELGFGLGRELGFDLGGVERHGLLLARNGMAEAVRKFGHQRAFFKPTRAKSTHGHPRVHA